MSGQDKSLTKKRGRPIGVKHGEFVGLRLPSDLANALDAWAVLQPKPRPSRSEAIRRLVERGLTGVPDATDAPQGLRAAILRTIETAAAVNYDEDELLPTPESYRPKGITLYEAHGGGPSPAWFVEGVKAFAEKSDSELAIWLYEAIDHEIQTDRFEKAVAADKAAREAKAAAKADKAAAKEEAASRASARAARKATKLGSISDKVKNASDDE